MWRIRDPVVIKRRPILSRFLGLDELERRDLSCAYPLLTIGKNCRLRTLDDPTEQAAGESNEGGSESQIFSLYDFSVPRTGRH